MQSGIELNSSHHSDCFSRLEISFQGSEEVDRVNGDIDEDVKGFNLGDVHGDKAAMRVVY